MTVDIPTKNDDTGRSNSVGSPRLDSARTSGLSSLIKDSKGYTKANQTVLMTQEELKKILEERL